MGKYIVAITGASGSAYGQRLLEVLFNAGHEVLVTISRPGLIVLREELGWELVGNEEEIAEQLKIYLLKDKVNKNVNNSKFNNQKKPGKIVYYDEQNISAPIASGSLKTEGMIVIPCTMSTVSEIACGASSNLIGRSADVILKEKRPLIIVPRETPLNVIHLRNLLTLAELGVYVVPAMPGFYHHPQTIQDLIDFIVGRVMDLLKLEHNLIRCWSGLTK